MSTLKLDNWTGLADTSAVKTMVQFAPYRATLHSSYDGGGYISLGTNADYNTLPNPTTGIPLYSFPFKPKYSDSILVLETSMLCVQESSNVSDDYRLYAVDGENNLLCWARASSTHQSFRVALNGAVFGLRGTFGSWGTTNRLVTIRIDTSGSSSSVYAFNPKYQNSWTRSPFYVTMSEYR